MDIP